MIEIDINNIFQEKTIQPTNLSRYTPWRVHYFMENAMPIITLEYTSNLSIDKKIRPFSLETHQILVDVIKTDLRTCRSQIIKIDDYVIGDGNLKNASIVLTIRMLPGRSDETKHQLGKILLDKIHHDFSDEIAKYDTQIRVYLTEIDKKYYYGLE